MTATETYYQRKIARLEATVAAMELAAIEASRKRQACPDWIQGCKCENCQYVTAASDVLDAVEDALDKAKSDTPDRPRRVRA